MLRAHCREVGRDYDGIEKTTATVVDLGEDRAPGLKALLEHLRELAAIGIDHVLLGPRGPWDEATLEAVASILPEVHAMPTRG